MPFFGPVVGRRLQDLLASTSTRRRQARTAGVSLGLEFSGAPPFRRPAFQDQQGVHTGDMNQGNPAGPFVITASSQMEG